MDSIDERHYPIPSTLCTPEVGSGKTIGIAEATNGLYVLKDANQDVVCCGDSQKFANQISSLAKSSDEVLLWHFRLGHPSFTYLERLFPKLFINKKAQFYQCEVCQLAKHTKSNYPSIGYRPTHPFAIIHSDIWGPMKVKTLNGARWFVTFIDDHSRQTWTYLMKDKSETRTIFQQFYMMICAQFHAKIQILKTDNARDYFNNILSAFLTQNGIIHVSSCVETPQQNGIAERKNRHLLEVARACMFARHVPKYLWGDAVLTATYLINRMPSRVLQFQTPRQVLLNVYPQLTSISSDLPPRIFGCTAFVHINPIHRTKLDPRSHKCVFIGYSPHQKGYKCYSPVTRQVYHTRDVTFFESQSYFTHTELQGEIGCESQIWDLIRLETDTCPATSITEQGEPPNQPELKVYKRRQVQPTTETETVPVQPTTETETVQTAGEQTAVDTLETTIQEENQPAATETENPDDTNLDVPIAIRKGVRRCTTYPIGGYLSYKGLSPSYKGFVSSLDGIEIPRNIQEARQHPKWKQATVDELQALHKNQTWEVVTLPAGKRTIDCKWLFTIKYNSDGSIERFKARLVACGFTQTHGIDYEETFAPVAKLNTIRILLSLAANSDWDLHQLDVKNAFLNGELSEEVYMNPPPGVNYPGKVCKLKKALYGLKQSPHAWFERFTKAVKSAGYYQCQSDHTLFVKHSSSGKMAILIVYVDDIIITGDDSEEIQQLKLNLASVFDLKDLGELKYFLGIEVARSKEGICLSQRKYVLDLLKETGMLGCKPSDTPMEPNKRLSRDSEVTPVDKESYQRLVGKLIYLSHTRLDIGYSVSIVSQYMKNPNEEHLKMVMRILRYLKMSPGKGLLFKKHHQRHITIYTNASWAGELTERRSTTGYCTYVWGNLVTWRSKKQTAVARSSAEAEYRAVAHGIQEGVWLRKVLAELKVKNDDPIEMLCDSQAAISIVKNPVQHDRMKHVEIDRHFITDNVTKGIVKLDYVPSKQQIADILTKALARDLFDQLVFKLGMYNIYTTKLEGEC
ncbi:Retrovirus-related Pol polyprotein from transposon TNT 1-94 [Linum perenne]